MIRMSVFTEKEKELSRQLTKYWDLLNSLFKFSESIGKATSSEEIWQKVGTFCLDTIGAAGVMIIQASNHKIIYNRSVADEQINIPLLEGSSVEKVLKLGGILLRTQINKEELDQWGLGDITVSAFLAVPIKAGNEIWGAIALWHCDPGRIFTNEENELLQQCVSQISIMLMSKSLAEAERRTADWRRISGEIAHLVKDPITLIAIWLEDLRKQLDQRTEKECAKIFDNINEKLTEMDEAIRLCFLFSVDPIYKRKEPLSISILLEEILQEFPLVKQQQFEIQFDQSSVTLRVEANPLRFRFAIRELLTAVLPLATSQKKAFLTFTLSEDDKNAIICITVYGKGLNIPEQDKKNVFNSDFFLETNLPGFQMSLMLAKQIIEEHNGKIDEIGQKENELKFKIEIPVWKET